MRFTHLSLRNFMSYGDTQTINLDQQGLVAVLGFNRDAPAADSNGAGKTSLITALFWCLYGSTMRGVKGDEVVNKSAGADCLVEVGVEDGGVNWSIIRVRKCRSLAKPNCLRVFRDGEEITFGTNSDTQQAVNTLIGMNANTFMHSVLLTRSGRPFSMLTDSDQKQILEDILQIKQLSKARDHVRDTMAVRQNELASVKSKIGSIEDIISSQEALVGQYKERQSQHRWVTSQKRFDLLRKKASIEAEIEQIYTGTGLDKLLELRDDLVEKGDTLDTERSNVQAERLTISRNYADKRSKLAAKEGELRGQLLQLRKNIETYNQLAGHACPTCHQVLDIIAAENAVAAWEAEAKHQSEATSAAIAKIRKEIDTDEAAKLAGFQKRLDSIEQQAKQNRVELQQVETSIQKRQTSLARICQLEQAAYNLSDEIRALDEAVDPYQELLDDALAALDNARRERRLDRYTMRAIEMELEHLAYWKQAFSNQGVKSYLLDNVTPFLTKRAQEYADILTDGDITIQFSTQTQLKSGDMRDRFQVQAFNSRGSDIYAANSDGQRQRIDLAVGWALADLAASRATKPIRFRALDEPFVHLDTTGEDLVVKLLHHAVDQYETILCITHSTHLRDQFAKEVKVVYENGFSRVES